MAVQGLNFNMNVNLNGLTHVGTTGKYRGRENLFMSMLGMVMSGSDVDDMLTGIKGSDSSIVDVIVPDNGEEHKSELNLNQINVEELLSMYGSLVEAPNVYDENVLTALRDSMMLTPNAQNSVQNLGMNLAEGNLRAVDTDAFATIANMNSQYKAEGPVTLDAVDEKQEKTVVDANNFGSVKQKKVEINEEFDALLGAEKMHRNVDGGLKTVDAPVAQKATNELQGRGLDIKDNRAESTASGKEPADSLMSSATVYEKATETPVREVIVQVNDESSQIKTELVAHIKDEITVAVKDGKQEINMELYPKELGRVNIKLNVEDGVLKVVIKADNPEVQSIIKSASAELTQTLKSGVYENVAVKTLEPDTIHIHTPEMFDRNTQSDMTNHQGNHDNRRHNEYYAEDAYGDSDDDTANLSFEEFVEMMKGYRV